MWSFDVDRLSTNVPLEETINTCAEALYDKNESQLYFLTDKFAELMHSATSTGEFSVDNIIYKQIDKVATGSPFGPALFNIFVKCHEEKLFLEITRPAVYFRYVDDIFAVFQNEESED